MGRPVPVVSAEAWQECGLQAAECSLSAFITTLHSVEGNCRGDIAVNVTEITVIFVLQQRCYLPGSTATRFCSEVGEWNSRCRRKNPAEVSLRVSIAESSCNYVVTFRVNQSVCRPRKGIPCYAFLPPKYISFIFCERAAPINEVNGKKLKDE